MWRNFIYIIRNTEIIGFGNFSLFVISKKLRYGTSYIYSSSHNIFNVVLIYLSKIDLLREINFFVSTKSTIWLTELDYLVDHQKSKKKWTKRNNRSPRPAFEKSRFPRIVLQKRELYLTSVSGTVRSNAWNGRKILRRILVHNETAPSDSSGRSSSLQFSENSFCAQRNPRFFLLDNLEALPIYVLEICKVHFATRRRGNVLCLFSSQVAPSRSWNLVAKCIPFEKFSFHFILGV